MSLPSETVAADVAVAITHPTQDNWVTVGGDVVAVALGYAVGKVVVGPALGALARRFGPAAGAAVAAEAAAAEEAVVAEQAAAAKAEMERDLVAASKKRADDLVGEKL